MKTTSLVFAAFLLAVSIAHADITITGVTVNETAYLHMNTDSTEAFRMRINATSNESISDMNLSITYPKGSVYKIKMTGNGNNTNGSWTFYNSNWNETGKYNFTINLTNSANESILYSNNFSVNSNSPLISVFANKFPDYIRGNNTNDTNDPNGTSTYQIAFIVNNQYIADSIWINASLEAFGISKSYNIYREKLSFDNTDGKWQKIVSFKTKVLNTTFLGKLRNNKFNLTIYINDSYGNTGQYLQEMKFFEAPIAETSSILNNGDSYNDSANTKFGLDVNLNGIGGRFAVVVYPNNSFSNYSFLGLRFYEITANPIILSKLINATIRFYYNDSEFGATNESTLKVRFYNETSAKWTNLSSLVNTTNNFVQAVVTHFSSYSVGGDDIIPETTTITTTVQPSSSSSGGGIYIEPKTSTTTTTILSETQNYSWSPYDEKVNQSKCYYLEDSDIKIYVPCEGISNITFKNISISSFEKPTEPLLESVNIVAWKMMTGLGLILMTFVGGSIIGWYLFFSKEKHYKRMVKRK